MRGGRVKEAIAAGHGSHHSPDGRVYVYGEVQMAVLLLKPDNLGGTAGEAVRRVGMTHFRMTRDDDLMGQVGCLVPARP